MNVHVGQITSEVSARPASPTDDGGEDAATSTWDERVRLSAMLDRLALDRRRTATGYSDD